MTRYLASISWIWTHSNSICEQLWSYWWTRPCLWIPWYVSDISFIFIVSTTQILPVRMYECMSDVEICLTLPDYSAFHCNSLQCIPDLIFETKPLWLDRPVSGLHKKYNTKWGLQNMLEEKRQTCERLENYSIPNVPRLFHEISW